MKKFNKTLKTEEQIALGNQYKEIQIERKELIKIKQAHLYEYYQMEGTKAVATIYDGAEMGYRGYTYKYANDEDKREEQNERDIYYNNNVQVLEDKIKKLDKQLEEIDNQLCLLLWGKTIEEYHEYQQYLANKQELEKLKEKIAYYEERVRLYENKVRG